MRHLRQLLLERAVEVGVVVAMDIRPNRRVPVEVTPPFPVDQPGTLAADQVEPRVVLVLLHLRERVPPETPISGIEDVQGGRDSCRGSRHPLYLGPSQPIVKPEVRLGLQ